MNWLATLATGVAISYLAVAAAVFALQRSMQYLPDRRPMDPAAAGLASVRQEAIATADGERIVVWWAAPREAGRPVYVYLHGNGASLANRAARFERLIADGSGLVAVSWRGYGGSSGSPSEAGLLADARAAFALARERAGPSPIVLYGESLGSTVAVRLAAEAPPSALVLDSSFDSALALARGAYPWLPVDWLLLDTYRADLAAPRVTAPVLQVHCRDDPVTPLAHAERLRRLLPRAEPLLVLDDACHIAPLERYEDALRDFVRRAVAGAR